MVAPHHGLPSVALPSGFQWRLGAPSDRKQLRHCLQLAFAEAFPEQTSWDHLTQTVERYFHPVSSPLWWIEHHRSSNGECEIQKMTAPHGRTEQVSDILVRPTVACVWACQGIGQATGRPVAYIMALWVSPNYRRQGLGSAAIQVVQEWGERSSCDAIELQVFGRNQAARMFYRSLGFEVAGTWLQLSL